MQQILVYCILLIKTVHAKDVIHHDGHIVYEGNRDMSHWLSGSHDMDGGNDTSSSTSGSRKLLHSSSSRLLHSSSSGHGTTSKAGSSGGMKTVVVLKNVLNNADGKLYTVSHNENNDLNSMTAPSITKQIQIRKLDAINAEVTRLKALKTSSEVEAKLGALEAQKNLMQVQYLQKAKEENDALMKAPRVKLVKPIIPIPAFDSYDPMFSEHQTLAENRIIDISKAALAAGKSQKRNSLLHKITVNPPAHNTISDEPDLVSNFYKNAPVLKKSVVVDPSKGKFTVINGDDDSDTHSAFPASNGDSADITHTHPQNNGSVPNTGSYHTHEGSDADESDSTVNGDDNSLDWVHG